MNENLTIKEALAKLLKEKKYLLKDSRALMTALKEHEADYEDAMDLEFFREALVDANIGELLFLAEESDKDAREKAKAEAMAKLNNIHMLENGAEKVVQQLTEAMGWNREPPPDINKGKFIPVIDEGEQKRPRKPEKTPTDTPARDSETKQEKNPLPKVSGRKTAPETRPPQTKIDIETKDTKTEANNNTGFFVELYQRTKKNATIVKAFNEMIREIDQTTGFDDIIRIRTKFMKDYQVTAFKCVNSVDRINSPEKQPRFEECQASESTLWRIQLSDGIFAALPSPSEYDGTAHFYGGLKELFDSNYANGTYQKIEVLNAAIMSPDFKLINKGKLILSRSDETSKKLGNSETNVPSNEASDNEPNLASLYMYCYIGIENPEGDNYNNPITYFDKAIELNPNLAKAYLSRGNAYYCSNLYDQAIEDYSHIINVINPNDLSAYFNRAHAYGSNEDHTLAIFDYTRVIKGNPNYAEAYNNRGIEYQKLKQYEQAIQDLNKAIELDPRYVGTYINRAEVYQKIGQYERAIQDYDKVIELNPKHAGAYTNRASTYFKQGNYDKAIADYTEAIKLQSFKDSDLEYNNRGVAYFKKGDYDHAILDFTLASKSDYGPAKKNLQLAKRAAEKKDPPPPPPPPPPEDWKKKFLLALNGILKWPKRAVVLMIAGVILISLFIAVSIHNDRNLAREHNDSGLAYQKKKQYEKALEEFDQAIKLYPGYADAHYNRGEVYYEKVDRDKALTDFDRAMELNSTYTQAIGRNPQYAEAYFKRGDAYSEKGETDKAIDDYSKVIELNPQYAEAYFKRSDAYSKKGETDKAQNDFNQGLGSVKQIV